MKAYISGFQDSDDTTMAMQPFPAGELPIYSRRMESISVFPSPKDKGNIL